MNKKFSTLVASFLLAGGLFSSANASIQEMVEGQYYRIAVAAAGVNGSSFFLDSEKSASNWYSSESITDDVDGSTWWRIEKIYDPVDDTKVVAYRLINKAGKYYEIKDGDNTYNAFLAQEKTNEVTVSNGIDGLSAYWVLVPYEAQTKCAYQGKAVESTNTKWGFHNVKIEPIAQTEEQLDAFLGDGFGLQIGYMADENKDGKDEWHAYSDLKGNVFADALNYENGMLQTEDGKFVVLTNSKWSGLSTDLTGGDKKGYKFALKTQKEIDADDKATTKTILSKTFTISVPATTTGWPLEVIADGGYELLVAEVNGSYYVTTGKDGNPSYAEYTKAEGHNTYVKFGANNLTGMSVFYDKLWNITNEDGYVANPSCSGNAFIVASQVNTTLPEGQWLWNGSMFINRESGKTLSLGIVRDTDKDNVYNTSNYGYLTITEAGVPGSTFSGYLNGYTADQLKQKAFFIGTPVKATGDTVYLAKGTDNSLYLTADKADATEFRFTTVSWSNNDNKTVNVAQHYTSYKGINNKGKEATKTDTLNIYVYQITETVTGLGLYYDSENDKYVLSGNENMEDYAASRYIVIKEKSTNAYNLISASISSVNYDKGYFSLPSFCSLNKLYGAHNTAELVGTENAYQYTQNDLFVIEDADAARYRSVADMDTIKIYRNADNNYVMYEKGEFLGMENIQDATYSDMAAAMLADTAAGKGTYRPQYLLAVGANVVPAGKYCDIHGANAGCKDEHLTETRGYVEGRYLVNLVDSAKAATEAGVLAKNNKFMYQNYYSTSPYYKLAFVPAVHMGDSLIIKSTEATAADTINLTNNDVDKVCTFAFRYVDTDRDAFIIETLYQNYLIEDNYGDVVSTYAQRGYIKYHNGVPVVTPQRSEAEVFDLEKTSEAPTANEAISAAAVTVVAGEGNVTIAGAAGKKVVIANILGQTIANTVLTSDNATIAAPAGVVVVAVEGEAAVKAIVK